MRTTLALGAMPPPPLLLLLILSPLSVSQEDGDPPSQISAATTTTITSTDQGPRPELTNMTLPSTDASAVSATTTLPQVQGDSSTESRGSVVTTVPPQPEPSVLPSKSDDNPSVGSPTATLGGSQDVKLPTTTIPSTDNRLVPTGDQSIGGGSTTAPSATQGGNQPPPSPSSQPTDTVSTSKSPPVLLSASTASPYQSTEATSEAPESSSVGQHSPATIPGTFGPVSSPGFPSTSQGPPSMHTPPAISEEPELTSSQMPAGPTQPFPTAPQPTGSSAETGWTPTIGEATSFSSDLAPTTPKGPSTPSPTSTVGNHKVKCDPAIRPDEKLLILNLTEASLCAGSPPDDKLVSLLCQSVKASFNPARDQCTVQVAPVIESHAVAVKRIIIETKLPPKDVFELLKNKWEELREVGVSDMRLGNEGPPDDMNEDRFSMPLIITIVCMASFLLLVAALYGCCHQRLSQRKDQQRLTEELQTVENGYHDNPTLEVMETSSEMQEKKVVNLNGELGDSWIVPLDNLAKDDLDEEEDTHL